jgi:hypothetical protein
LIVSVTMPGISAMPAVAEAMQRQLGGEVAALRESGSRVAVIVPDEASSQSFGLNLMDFSRREPVAEAGTQQGLAEAERLREFWVGASTVSA